MSNFDCIMVSGYRKSGTTLLENILESLTGRESLNMYLKNNIHSFLQMDQPVYTDVRVPYINFTDKSTAIMEVFVLDKYYDVLEKFTVELNIKELHELFGDRRFYSMNYTSPANISKKTITSRFEKKLFVMRDFRDVYNSFTKYAGSLRCYVEKLSILGSYESYQKYFYLNVDSFYMVLNQWKNHIKEYLENKDELFLVKYEDLIQCPADSIKKISSYLCLDVSEETVAHIIDNLFNKELKHVSQNAFNLQLRHFSGSSKRSGEWLEWFNDDMVEIVKREIGDYLVEFGYEKDNNWSVPSVDSGEKAAFRQKQNFVYSSYKHKGQFAMMLDILLEKKRAAIYGAGLYTHRLLNVLDNSSNIVFIADDDSCKWGGYINGVEISGSENLIKRYMDYDVLLVAVHPQHRGKVIEKLDEMTISRCIMIDAYNENIDFGIFA